MPYDVFISYSRRDNEEGRITQLVERVETDFAAFAGRPLLPFFDASEIHGMDDWRHRILQGLRESRLLLACLSPAYLQSEYCEWEFNEYLKHEIGRAYFGDGVAPIYFAQVPGWEDKGFGQQCAAWVAELRRRQHFDLRPWFRAGEKSLRDATVRERMRQLNIQLKERITRGERAQHSLGNVDAHNPHFIGRTTELRRLRETVALGKVGVLTAVHGLGGVGKTSLAIEYAHAFAHEYGGGRWQVRCEGKEDLRAGIAELAAPLALELNENEKKNIEMQFQRVLAELHRLADAHTPHRCLLLLDNVDKPRLLEPAQAQSLPAGEWLHVVATTRLGETDLYGRHKDRAFLPVDELPEAHALELIETYQPNRTFASGTEREAARALVNLLGRFTLAVESAAVYLGQFSEDVTCAGFLDRLKKEGLDGLAAAAKQTSEGVRHGEMCLKATLAPTLERLSGPEKLALSYAALLPADHIVLSWLRALVAASDETLGRDSAPGYPDSWATLLRRLLELRLLQVTRVAEDGGSIPVARMHRLIQSICREKSFTKRRAMRRDLFNVVKESSQAEPIYRQALWDAEKQVPRNEAYVASAVSDLGRLLLALNRPTEAAPLIRNAFSAFSGLYGEEHPETLTVINDLAVLSQQTGDLASAEWAFRKVLDAQMRGLGPAHPSVLITINNLAGLLDAKEDFAAAEPMYRHVLEGCSRAFGSRHPETVRARRNLIALLDKVGRCDEATLMRNAEEP